MTTSPPAPPAATLPPTRPGVAVGEAARAHIARLQHGYCNDRPDAVAAVARIRRGAGKAANELPDLWGLIGTETLYEAGLDEARLIRAEQAVHTAVTLWALHQQSQRTAPMHLPGGPGLGDAVRRLMPDGELDEAVRRRFVRAGTASTLDVLAQRLRDLVVLLRRAEIPLDYGLLAEQLYWWQSPAGRGAVHRAWGRGFHAHRPGSAGDGGETPQPAATGETPATSAHPATDDTDKDPS